ncbi:MAG: ATP-dependent sacrificial sulfur transferase LarE [Candidatus Omnitrophica bacterium]|nr:ATP-dependent sacrificial sulfur transferase LarE [Candidatus Omnitrophota bacterium]
MKSIDQKYEKLQQILAGMESVIIGYSGGVDSTFLAKVATDALGDKALCVAALSESYPRHEREEAAEFARRLGLHFITINTFELDNPDYRKNAPDRCYHCKKEILSQLQRIARERGFQTIALGTNFDDLGDYRPGQQAASESGARSPMVEAELTKDDIRTLSKRLNLPTWDKPSFACLSSRFPYGEEISKEKLEMVDRAEQVLREHHFRQFRVRHHDNLARIEVPSDEMQKLLDHREEIVERLRTIGYRYVSMDLTGYRTGSMNEALHQIESPVLNP